MRLQRTMSVWKITMTGLAMLLGGCGLPDPPRAGSAKDAQLLLAQSRWQAGHPMRYRLVVQEDTDDRSCRQAVEVRDEQVETVLEDHCGRATPWTVSRLRDWLSYRARTSSACTTASLACTCQVHHSARRVRSQAGLPILCHLSVDSRAELGLSATIATAFRPARDTRLRTSCRHS
jgi:hypothetical protein